MKIRLTVLALIVVAWGALAFLLSDFSPLSVSRVTVTPTRTPQSTFTATATATTTLTPSATPTPTDTPTATPVPTNTPVPTATPLPSDTPTAIPSPTATETPLPPPTPTATRQPAPQPTTKPTNTQPPPPTSTPAPPFMGRIIRGYTNCSGYAGVTGHVYHASGDPYADVAVGVWSDGWEGRVSMSEANGKYDVELTGIFDTFTVAVVRLETCSQQDGRWTAKNCQVISNLVANVLTTEQCTGEGANQVTEIEFRGP